jgi:hypothetical protein
MLKLFRKRWICSILNSTRSSVREIENIGRYSDREVRRRSLGATS